MKDYDDLYIFLRNKFGGQLFINLDVLDYLEEIELHCKYKETSFVISDFYSEDLQLHYQGDSEFILGTVVPILSEFMGEPPVCKYDVVNFETLEKRYMTVEWSHNKKLAEEYKENPAKSIWTFVRNVEAFEHGKKLEKKIPHV